MVAQHESIRRHATFLEKPTEVEAPRYSLRLSCLLCHAGEGEAQASPGAEPGLGVDLDLEEGQASSAALAGPAKDAASVLPITGTHLCTVTALLADVVHRSMACIERLECP